MCVLVRVCDCVSLLQYKWNEGFSIITWHVFSWVWRWFALAAHAHIHTQTHIYACMFVCLFCWVYLTAGCLTLIRSRSSYNHTYQHAYLCVCVCLYLFFLLFVFLRIPYSWLPNSLFLLDAGCLIWTTTSWPPCHRTFLPGFPRLGECACFSWLSTEILCLSESVDFLSLLAMYLPVSRCAPADKQTQ